MELAERRYAFRASTFIGIYAVLNVAAIVGVFDHVGQIGHVVLGLAVAAPIAGHFWAILTYIRDSDEFVRALTARRFIIASGLAMSLACAWGFMENYGKTPHAPGWMIYVLFNLIFCASEPFIKSTR